MIGVKGKGVEVSSDFVFPAVYHGDDVGRCACAVESPPKIHQLIDHGSESGRDQGRPRGHIAKIPLGKIIGDPGDMIHVVVTDEDMVDRQELLGRLSDIETNVERRDSDHGFFPGDGIALQSKAI